MSDDGTAAGRNIFIGRSDGELRLTANTSVSVPAPTAATHALAWGSDAEVDDLTATGDVTVSSDNPILEMYDTNGTAEQRRWRLQVVADDMRVRLMSDDGLSIVATPMRFEDGSIVFAEDGQSVDMTGATSVAVPALSADGLEIAPATNAIVKLENTSRTDADTRTAWLDNAGQSFYIRSIDSVGALNRNFAAFNHSTGVTNLTGSSSVTVPAVADGATEAAAQVTARDSGTGQLAIAGIELGDTGWRDVTASLINGWTATYVLIRRFGSTVEITAESLNSTASTNVKFLDAIAGFGGGGTPATWATSAGTNTGKIYKAWDHSFNGADPGAWTDNLNLMFTTNDAWPSSLPGTAA